MSDMILAPPPPPTNNEHYLKASERTDDRNTLRDIIIGLKPKESFFGGEGREKKDFSGAEITMFPSSVRCEGAPLDAGDEGEGAEADDEGALVRLRQEERPAEVLPERGGGRVPRGAGRAQRHLLLRRAERQVRRVHHVVRT